MDNQVSYCECPECKKSFYNQPQLNNHVFLTHELPAMFSEGDEILDMLRKAYAYHTVRGHCDKHRECECICIHPFSDSKENELVLKCYPCMLDANNNEVKE